MTLSDDKVCLTNLNRQIIATRSTVGPVSYTHLDVYKRQDELTRRDEELPEEKPQKRFGLFARGKADQEEEMCIRDRYSTVKER